MKLLATTTLALGLAASGAAAEEHMSDGTSSSQMSQMTDQLIRARDITRGTVYTTDAANDEGWDSATVYESIGTEWNAIGEIEDVVLSRDGEITGIVAEIGGFLDIADKHVMISIDDLNLVAADSYAYVTRMSEEELESMQGVDEAWYE